MKLQDTWKLYYGLCIPGSSICLVVSIYCVKKRKVEKIACKDLNYSILFQILLFHCFLLKTSHSDWLGSSDQ